MFILNRKFFHWLRTIVFIHAKINYILKSYAFDLICKFNIERTQIRLGLNCGQTHHLTLIEFSSFIFPNYKFLFLFQEAYQFTKLLGWTNFYDIVDNF
jgi:hypothetical protein